MALIFDLSAGVPSSCDSSKPCTFSVAANGTTPVIVGPGTPVTFVFRNRRTGASASVGISISVDTNIAPNSPGGTALFVDVTFNDLIKSTPSLVDPGITCGGGFQLEVEAVASDTIGNIHQSCDPTCVGGCFPYPCLTTEVSLEPCVCTEIMDVFTTIDSYTCVGEDGSIGVQGKLFEVTCGGGIPSPFVNLPGTEGVSVGLTDPATGIYYEYVRASTDNTGTFSIAFGINARQADVIPLIPSSGTKVFNLTIFYPGTGQDNLGVCASKTCGHAPSNIFSRSITIVGRQAGSAPCALGTLLLDTVYGVAPKGAEVHTIQYAFAGGIPGVSDFNALAMQVRDSAHDAIISAGTSSTPVTPLEIKVYRGPDIQVPAFFGFVALSSGSFNVVATAMGSPVAGLVIVAIIVVALVILAFFVFLIMSTVKDIIASGGGGTLTAIAVAVTAVAIGGVAIYVLSRPRVKRALK